MKKKIIWVSNRLPVQISKKRGKLIYQDSPGGLATCLRTNQNNQNFIFVGWPGYWTENKEERLEITRTLLKEYKSYPVFISPWELDRYYYGYANQVLWPLFHYFITYCDFNSSHWQVYQKINRRFYHQLMNIADPEDCFWIHDFHLLLLPLWLKRRFPQNPLGFFLHTPFPSPDILKILPNKEQILSGMAGADVLGFHTQDYAKNFLQSAERFLGFFSHSGSIHFGEHALYAHEFPLGVDFETITGNLSSSTMSESAAKLKKKFKGKKIILSIDRMDYSKGLPERLRGIEIFLEKNPTWREKCQFVMFCQPSRTKIKHYIQLKNEVDTMIGHINGRFGRPGWTPIRYLFRSLPFRRLLPLYKAADVALVTPWFDGMNLISKEFVASKSDNNGVLILSETAGAAEELREAVLINIHDQNAVASALDEALHMNEEEKMERMAAMRKKVSQNTSRVWMKSFLQCLEDRCSPGKDSTPPRFFSEKKPGFHASETGGFHAGKALYQIPPTPLLKG